MAMPYGNLNADVFYIILQYLPKKDLISACRTTKAIRIIAEQFLYRRIDLCRRVGTGRQMAGLLNTIMRRPELGKHVRILRFNGAGIRNSKLWHDATPEPQLVTRALERLTLPYMRAWEVSIAQGLADALLALLLVHTPSLTRLQLTCSWMRGPACWLGRVFAASLDEHSHVPRFEKLQGIFHRWFCNECPRPTAEMNAELLAFFYPPAIKNLNLTLGYPSTISWPADIPPCTNLVELTVDNVREGQMYDLLSATPNVKRLHWSVNYDPIVEAEPNINLLDLDAIMKALCLLKLQLEALTVQLVFAAPDEFSAIEETRIAGSIKGLSEFRALRETCIPMLFLGDFHQHDEPFDFHSVMTEATERLTLTDDLWRQARWRIIDEDIVGPLEHMLESWSERYPRLQSIIFRDVGWPLGTRVYVKGLRGPTITIKETL